MLNVAMIFLGGIGWGPTTLSPHRGQVVTAAATFVMYFTGQVWQCPGQKKNSWKGRTEVKSLGFRF